MAANRLPPELLAKILEFRHDDRDLISATHVCVRWRSTLLSTPLLWTEVAIGDLDRTLTYLERSKNALLHVSVGESALDSGYFSAHDMSWIGRTDSLCIYADREQTKSIAGRLCLPAPLLQSLTFDASFDDVGGYVQIPHKFLGRQAPSLRKLAFFSVSPIPVVNLPLQNLTNLRWTDQSPMVSIAELLAFLALAPLLEDIALALRVESTTGPERPRAITLSKLRKLVWANDEGPFRLISFIIAPELNDLSIHVTADNPHTSLSTLLPPYRDHFPLLVEPTALRYVYQSYGRSCHFTYPSGCLVVYEDPEISPIAPPTDNWLSSNTPISFWRTKELIVDWSDDHPPPGDIPIEQFKNLENLELVGEMDRLLHIIQPNRNATSGTLAVPFPSLLELRPTIRKGGFPFEVLAEVLRERKEAGHGVETVHVTGEYQGCSTEEYWELMKFVNVLMLD